MSRILIIEDDPAILKGLADNLRFENYEVATATSGTDALRVLDEHRPHLVVLDVMLPDTTGFELCRRFRTSGFDGAILLLTARSGEADRVLGLDLGADDYVTKPFSILEILARVRALLRRVDHPEAAPDTEILTFDDVEIDFRRYQARRAGAVVHLTPKEFGVLQCLSSRSGEVVTRDELLDEVWGSDVCPSPRTVDNHMASLRGKLEAVPDAPRRLLTVHGVGYRLNLEVTSP